MTPKMIITDYLLSKRDISWDFAKQCGVEHATLRLPEDEAFDVTELSHWETVHKKLTDFGIKPLVIEPMPNALHDHIKVGSAMRDECVEKALRMFPIMAKLGINTLCFNFMAHIGWLRTNQRIPERGGALVTGFDIAEFREREGVKITADELWKNYEYFVKAAVPEAEKYEIKLALHPDDPPLERLGDVERIMISYKNVERAMNVVNSPSLGVTMCQATYLMMGEDVYDVIEKLKEKIFFVHFRNAIGNKFKFNETFHDNGKIDMAKIMRHYKKCGVDVPIRVDHVPLMAGEDDTAPGYTALGRLFAIGYLKGIIDAERE